MSWGGNRLGRDSGMAAVSQFHYSVVWPVATGIQSQGGEIAVLSGQQRCQLRLPFNPRAGEQMRCGWDLPHFANLLNHTLHTALDVPHHLSCRVSWVKGDTQDQEGTDFAFSGELRLLWFGLQLCWWGGRVGSDDSWFRTELETDFREAHSPELAAEQELLALNLCRCLLPFSWT